MGADTALAHARAHGVKCRNLLVHPRGPTSTLQPKASTLELGSVRAEAHAQEDAAGCAGPQSKQLTARNSYSTASPRLAQAEHQRQPQRWPRLQLPGLWPKMIRRSVGTGACSRRFEDR
eukprot:1158604-Pelagomonas_calceolata.AAC.5